MKGSWRPWHWIVRPDPKDEVAEELRFHLEQRTRDYIARGMSPEAARQAAAQRLQRGLPRGGDQRLLAKGDSAGLRDLGTDAA